MEEGRSYMRTESSWYSPQLSPIQSKIKVGVQKRLVSEHVLHLLFFRDPRISSNRNGNYGCQSILLS